MLLFTVREDVRRGFEPVRLADGTYTYPIDLEEKFARDLEQFWASLRTFNESWRETRVQVRGRTLVRAQLSMDSGAFTLKRSFSPRHNKKPGEALVLMETAAGPGGKVHLTSVSYDEQMQHGRVRWVHREFPPIGITPLCAPDYVKQLCDGVDDLRVVLKMSPGSAFRVVRSGDLRDQEGAQAPTVMFVHWNGHKLWRTTPAAKKPAQTERGVVAREGPTVGVS